MLGKFLPFLNRARSQKPEPRPLNDSFDLTSESFVTTEDVPRSVLNGYFYFIIFIFALFLLLFSINVGFKIVLDKQKAKQDQLFGELNLLKTKQARVTSVGRKILFYKNSLEARKPLSDKTFFVMSKISPELKLTAANIGNQNFKVSLVGQNIYLFTQLIMTYLEDKSVSEISITSATLDAQSKEFKVELSGVFK